MTDNNTTPTEIRITLCDIDTECIFHDTNRDTDEYKEYMNLIRRRLVEAST